MSIFGGSFVDSRPVGLFNNNHNRFYNAASFNVGSQNNIGVITRIILLEIDSLI